MAAEGVKWLAVLVVLAFFAFVAILLHLMFQLTRRWKKLREAAMVEADLIKARKQGPKWDAQEILPGIWLGSFPAAIKDDELRRRNITHIISIGAEFTPVYPDQFSYLVAFAMDCPGQNVMDYFPHTNRFIDAAISSGSAVLVHCQAGISRSATLVAAYMLAQQGLSSTQVLNSIKTIRPCISPNVGFRKQLQSWEHEVNGNPNASTIRRWALAGVSVGGCLIHYQRRTTEYVLGNRLKDQAMRLGFQALLTHGSLLARTAWGQRFLAKLLGQG